LGTPGPSENPNFDNNHITADIPLEPQEARP
jgi:hypothetical protein